MTKSSYRKMCKGAKASGKIQKERKQNRVAEYLLEPTKCKKCDRPLSYEKRHNQYCSRSCSISQNNMGIPRNVTHGRNKPKRCAQCKKMTTNRKFCSRKCFNDNKKEQTNRLVLSGKYSKNFGSQRTLSRVLISHRGHQCEVCKLFQWQGETIPINVHHKDGDAKNNKADNLQLLCLNCHGLTNNYGRKNSKSSRQTRH